MLLSGRTLLCHSDAIRQQYTTLCYTARAIRNLLAGRGIRMVDLSLGQGMDALAALGFYGLTNPFYWLGALFTGRGLEMYYHFLVFLYSHLTGLTFGLYLERTGLLRQDRWAIPVGALFYGCCGFNMAALLKTPYFSSGSICLCLMLWAVEGWFRDRRWFALTLVTLVTVIVNFYMGFQTLLLAAGYVVLRLLYGLRDRGLRGTVREGLSIFAACTAGLCLSGFMLVPTAAAFMDSARAGEAAGYTASLLWYPGVFYRQLLACFSAPYSQADYWTVLNFFPWISAGVFALFVMRRCRRSVTWLKVGWLLTLIGICVPAFGKLLNGGGYVTNRWCYGFSFASCLCASVAMPELFAPGFERRRLVGRLMVLWGIQMAAMAALGIRDNTIEKTVAGVPLSDLLVAFGALLAVITGVFILLCDRSGEGRSQTVIRRAVGASVALCCLTYSAGYGLSMFNDEPFLRQGLDDQIAASAAGQASAMDSGALSRVDTGFNPDCHASLLGYCGTGYYWSIVPATVAEYYRTLDTPTLRWVFRLDGLGSDPYLCAAASVGSAVRSAAGPEVLPYGFDADPLTGGYRNRYALPLGLFYHRTLSEARYLTLSALEKREALLSAAVIAEGQDALPELDEGASSLLNVETSNGVTLKDGRLSGCEGGTIILSYDAPEGDLTWLRIRQPKASTVKDETNLIVRSLNEAGERGAFYVSLPTAKYYFEQSGLLVYLGQASGGAQRLALRLESEGELAFEAMDIVSLPASDYVGRVEALAANGWSPRIANDRVYGRCTAPADGVLQLSIPWSKGWRATINGTPAELKRCGGMYMGLELKEGEWDVELRYETPYLRAGIFATLIGAVLTAAASLFGAIARRRKR